MRVVEYMVIHVAREWRTSGARTALEQIVLRDPRAQLASFSQKGAFAAHLPDQYAPLELQNGLSTILFVIVCF